MTPRDEQVFTLLMARFDTIEEQNDAQLALLNEHIKVDNAVHAVVVQHSTYWSIMRWSLAAIGGLVTSILGFLGLHK